MKRSLGIILLVLTTVIVTACGADAKYDKLFDEGIEALKAEDSSLALEKFEAAKEIDAGKEATLYIDAMKTAETINTYISDEAYDEAITAYEELVNETPYPELRFIFAESEVIVQEAIGQQKTIDQLTEELLNYFDLEDESSKPDPFYFELAHIILDLDYISKDQKKALEADLEEAKKRLTDLGEAAPETEKEKKKEKEEAKEAGADSSKNSNKDSDKSDEKPNSNSNSKPEDNQSDKDKNKDKEKPSSNKGLTLEEAEEKVRAFVDFDPTSGLKLNFDHEADGKYIFQYFEVVGEGNDSHTATLAWYQVDKKTGAISEGF